MDYMEYIGITSGILVSAFEIYTRLPPLLRRSFPNQFACYLDTKRYVPIVEALRQSQKIPGNKQWGARTIMGIYNDMQLMIDSPSYQVGVCGSIRPLNLVEFYWLIRNSPDWQPDIHTIISDEKKIEYKIRAKTCQPNLTDKECDMITTYYWFLQEIHQENP